jgi:hypothetical protein
LEEDVLSKYDEMLCHQTPTTFDHVVDTGDNWRENVWCCAHDRSGQFFLSSHFGISTNRNVMDASGLLMVDGKRQHNLRASRVFRPVTDEVRVGPLSYQIVEGMKRVTWALEENEHGHSWEVEFEATMPPQEEAPQFARNRGRVIENISRYAQTGRAKGWLKVDGKVHDIRSDEWCAHRDHSWGVRWQHNLYTEAQGFQPPEPLLGFLGDWHIFQFEDWAVCSSLREDHNGEVLDFTGSLVRSAGDCDDEVRLVGEEHDFRLVEGTRLLAGATITAIAEDGTRRTIEIKPITLIYLQAAGYWPYKGFRLGRWMGENWSDGEILDTSDPTAMRDVSAAPTFVVECRCGDQTGYGMIQFGIHGQHPKYAPAR